MHISTAGVRGHGGVVAVGIFSGGGQTPVGPIGRREGRILHQLSRWAARPVAQLRSPRGSTCQPVGTTSGPWVYALDIVAWAVCQACNTAAGSRPRALTLWPFFLAHSRIDFSVSRL